jgi:glycosyltransferase involved in cell wall biosynthesis
MLAIIGEDEEGYKGEILELMRRNNVEQKIVFTGHLEGENLIDAYSGLDMLVVPSYEENFSNVVIESSAQGTPCIVSEQVGLSGWVKENSIGIVLPLDIDTWRNEIRKIKKDRIGKIWERKRLRRLTENSFSTRKIAKEMLKNYKKIIEERGE